MANNRERLSDLESNMGMVQDELQKLTTGINDKFHGLEESFHRTIADSLNQMRELILGNRDTGCSASQANQRPDETQPPQDRDDVKPFAPALNPRRHVKLELPRFSDGDPTEWLTKAAQYFAYYDITGNQRIIFASYHLTEEANEWWQATVRALGIEQNLITWETSEEELWKRFSPTRSTNFHEELSKIRQTGTFQEYQRAFERLRNKVSNWSEEALVGTFLGGLHHTIADDVRMFQPKTLQEVINLARMKDDQLQKQKRTLNPRSQSFSTSNSRVVTTTPQRPGQTPKKLSWEELKRKRSLGLCFGCDEKYSPGHKCVNPQLFIMEGIDDTEEEDDEPEEHPTPEITLNALTGWDSLTTMCLLAVINNHNHHALVDSGLTHNFISEKAALELKLRETPSIPFDVWVANGIPLRCRRKFVDVQLQID